MATPAGSSARSAEGRPPLGRGGVAGRAVVLEARQHRPGKNDPDKTLDALDRRLLKGIDEHHRVAHAVSPGRAAHAARQN